MPMIRLLSSRVVVLGLAIAIVLTGLLLNSTSSTDEDRFPRPDPGFTGSADCISGHFVANPSDETVIIYMSAFQWRYSYCSITVFQGQEVIFKLKSVDIPHGIGIISIPEVDAFISPNAVSTVRFIASEKGEFEYFCTVFCGEGHPGHVGKLIVK